MHLPRRLLLILSTFAAVTAAGVGWYIVQRSAPDAALLRLYVDIGLIATLVLIVIGTTGARPNLVTELIEALRALSRGSHDARLDPTEFGALEEVARAYNEAAASLSEMDDPNLGPVKSSKRVRASESSSAGTPNAGTPSAGAPSAESPNAGSPAESEPGASGEEEKRVYARGPRVDANGDHLSDHPELGDVRPIGSRQDKPTPTVNAGSESGRAPRSASVKSTSKTKSKTKSSGRKAKQKKAAAAKSVASESEMPTVGPVTAPDVADDEAPTILEPASAPFETGESENDPGPESKLLRAAVALEPENDVSDEPAPDAGTDEVKPDVGVEVKPDVGVEVKPDVGVEVKPDVGAEVKPDVGAEVKPDVGAEVKPDEGVEVKPDEGVEVKPDESVEVKPDEGTEVKPDEGVENAGDETAGEVGPLLPSRADLRALFDDFVAKKIGRDEDVDDLEFHAFAETLEDEGRRLVSDHACRGIRFEITMESGEVSLLPHLLR